MKGNAMPLLHRIGRLMRRVSARGVYRGCTGGAMLLWAVSASAQDLDYDPRVLDGCLDGYAGAVDKSICIGMGAAHCIQTEAGSSTVGLGYCFSEEFEQWDARLNRVYQALLVDQVQRDNDIRDFNENLAVAEERLRQMQRAWITYRDAACDWEYAQWGGGTGAGPASAQCMMELTARQTLFLEARLP